MLLAEFMNLGEVVSIWYYDASYTLNRLDDKRSRLLTVSIEDLGNIIHIVVPDRLSSRRGNGANVGYVGTVVVF